MKIAVKYFLLLLLLTLGLTSPRQAKAYTPFYELSGPTRMGSSANLVEGHVDVATGAFCFRKHLTTITGYPTISSDVLFNSQDSSNGPFGKGTSTTYDWFVTHSTTWPGAPWVLIGPGNRHFIFDVLYQGINGIYTDTRDPQMLGTQLSFNNPPNGGLCTLTFKNLDRWEFDLSGGLTAIHTHCASNGSQNTLTITRDAATGFVIYVYQTYSPVFRGCHFYYGGSPSVCTQLNTDYNYTWGVSAGTIKTWTFGYINSNTTLSTLTDVQGRLSRITWASYTRSDGVTLPLVQSMVDNRGNTTATIAYDSFGRALSVAAPVTGSATFGWNDVIGTRSYVTVTMPGGHAYNVSWFWHTANTGYWIDTIHDLTLGEYTTYEKNASPTYLTTAAVDHLSHRYTMTWDTTEGNLLSYTYPTAAGGTATYSYQYDPVYHKRNSTTDPLGNVATQAVSSTTGDITSRTDAAGNVSSFLYTSNGDCYQVTDPLGNHINCTYDATTGLMSSVTDAAGHVTSYSLDPVGTILSVTRPNHHVVNYVHNTDGAVASTNELINAGATTIYNRMSYDANDNCLTFTDANGNVWSNSFDAANRLLSSTDPTGRPLVRTYNSDNSINTYTDKIGHVYTATYDSASRLTSQSFQVSSGGSVDSSTTFSYDPTTHLLSSYFDSAMGTTTLNRDSVFETTSSAQPYGTITRTYDILGRTATETVAGQPTITYHYNSVGLMDSETQSGLTTHFLYDKVGRLIQQQFPNGVTVAQVLDANGAILRATSTKGSSVLDDTVYTRNEMGNIATSQANGGPVLSWTYDELDRLTSRTDFPTLYQYDSVGNILVVQAASGTNTYSYDAAYNVIAINGVGVVRGAGGSLVSYGGNSYTWDARNRLVGYSAPGVSATFKYFPTGMTSQQTVNGVTTSTVMSGDGVLSEITNGVTTNTLNSPSFGAPVSRGGLYHSTNGERSTTLLTDASGNVVQNYTYTPTGTTTKTTGTDSPYQFKGTYNTGIGLDRMRAGWYDPTNPPLLAQANGGEGPAAGMGGMQWSGGRFGPTGMGGRPAPESESSWTTTNMGKTVEVTFKPGWDKGLDPVDPTKGFEPIDPTADNIRDVVSRPTWTGESPHPGVSNADNVIEGPIYGPGQFQKMTWKPRPPLPGEDPAGIGPDPMNPGGIVPSEGAGEGGAGGALGIAFTFLTPNPFDPQGRTPLDAAILDPLYNLFHKHSPPHYDPGLDAAVAADLAAYGPPMLPSDGPGSPLVPWPTN